jgi:hypothetical protein
MVMSAVFKPTWMKSQNPFTGPFFSWTVAAAYSITFGVIGTVLYYLITPYLQSTSTTKNNEDESRKDVEKEAPRASFSSEKQNNLYINPYAL